MSDEWIILGKQVKVNTVTSLLAITKNSNPQVLTGSGYSFLTHVLSFLLALALASDALAPDVLALMHSFSRFVSQALGLSRIGVVGVKAFVVGEAISI
jgi:hypothetical protein